MFNSVQEFPENGIVRKLNLPEMQFLPFLLIFLMPTSQSPAVQSVVRVDGLAAVGQVQLRSGLVQVGQVESRHVGVGGGGAAVQADDGLVLLHPPVLLCVGRSEVTALTPRCGDRRTFSFLRSSGVLAVTVQHSLGLSLVERLEGPVRSREAKLSPQLSQVSVPASASQCYIVDCFTLKQLRVHLTVFMIFN